MRAFSVIIPSLTVATLLLSVACDSFEDLERTYDITPDESFHPLIMNAQLDAGQEIHTVWLHLGGPDKTTPATVPDLSVTVNGAPVFQGETELGSQVFQTAFHPGDRVRFEARGGSVYSEVTVPSPAKIVAAEAVNSDEENLLKCRVTLRDEGGQKNWYRLGAVLEVRYKKHYPDERVEDCIIQRALDESDIDTSDDAVISSGYSTSDVDFNSLLVPENAWHIFDDSAFDGREVTLKPSISSFFINADWKYYLYNYYGPGEEYDGTEISDVQKVLLLKVYSLTEQQYLYLRAVTQLDYYGYDFNFLVEPVPLPTNVEGGLGIVAIDMPAVARIEL